MRLRVEIEPESRVRVFTLEGLVTDDSLYEAFLRHWSAPGYDPTFYDLVDLRQVTRFEVTGAGVRRLALEGVRAHRSAPAGRTAIVASEDLAFGLARMYQVYAGDLPREIRVLRDVVEARRWLSEGDAETSPARSG